MNTNHHDPTNEEIAECAYFIWESEGRPEGKGTEHWHQAELQLYISRVHDGALEAVLKPGIPAAAPAKPKAKAPKPAKVSKKIAPVAVAE